MTAISRGELGQSATLLPPAPLSPRRGEGGPERSGPTTLSAWLGRLRVTERVVGYERKRIFGGEVLSRHELELPEVSYETVGVWWAATPALEAALASCGPHHFLGSLHAAEHAAISLLPLLVLCDRGDLGGISTPFHPQLGCGGVFVYEGHSGGVGIAPRAFAALPELLARVGRLLDECPCETGCPSCVQSPKCGNGNRPLDKAGARRVVALLLGEEALAGGEVPWQLQLGAGDGAESDEGDGYGDHDERELVSGETAAFSPSAAPANEASRSLRRFAPRDDEEVGNGAGNRASNGASSPPNGESGRRDVAANGRNYGLPSSLPSSRSRAAAAAISTLNGHGSVSHSPGPGAVARLALGLRSRWRSWWRRRFARWCGALGPRRPRQHAALRPRDAALSRRGRRLGQRAPHGHRAGRRLPPRGGALRGLPREPGPALAAALRAARLVNWLTSAASIPRPRRLHRRRLQPPGATLDLLETCTARSASACASTTWARETLGNGKSPTGCNRSPGCAKAASTSSSSTAATTSRCCCDLYLFGRREGYVVWRDRDERRLRLPVRW